jgi:curved DNA-binding protein CbpA
MGEENHYVVLGVPPDATDAEIRSAFSREIKRSHPDASDVGRTLLVHGN